jgi:hypothetical protein
VQPCVVVFENARDFDQSRVMVVHVGYLLNMCKDRADGIDQKGR